MAGYPCCCGCTWFVDRFHRADSSSLGSAWSETSGDWSISNNALTTTATSGVCLCAESAPISGFFAHVVRCIVSGASGDKTRVIIDWQDASNCAYAEITWGQLYLYATTIKLHQVVGGTATELQSATITGVYGGDSLAVRVCVLSGRINVATASSYTANWTDRLSVAYTPSVVKAGVGTGSAASAAEWYDFRLSKHRDADAGCPGCETCDYCAADDPPPPSYIVTISGAALKSGYIDVDGVLDIINDPSGFVLDYRSSCYYRYGCEPNIGRVKYGEAGTPFQTWLALWLTRTAGGFVLSHRLAEMGSGYGTCSSAGGEPVVSSDPCACGWGAYHGFDVSMSPVRCRMDGYQIAATWNNCCANELLDLSAATVTVSSL